LPEEGGVTLTLELKAVEAELARLAGEFEEGEHGLLELALDRRLSEEELEYLHHEWDGRAFAVRAPLRQDPEGVLAVRFQVGVWWLPLVVLALGALPVGLLAWKLWRVPAEEWMRMIKGIVLPLGAMAVGGVVMMASGGRWPGLLAGGALMAGGGYLAYRELAPAPPPAVSELEALRQYGGVQQPELSVEVA